MKETPFHVIICPQQWIHSHQTYKMKCIIALCACIQYQIHFESHLNESVQIYPASSICKQVATTIGTLTPDPSVPWTREE